MAPGPSPSAASRVMSSLPVCGIYSDSGSWTWDGHVLISTTQEQPQRRVITCWTLDSAAKGPAEFQVTREAMAWVTLEKLHPWTRGSAPVLGSGWSGAPPGLPVS